ncbi:MAG: aldo/keto reductase [Tepidisphaeraceae bacterium]|jgi:aryl-alcohol dehydrogenase-like predicted oxidoreductase
MKYRRLGKTNLRVSVIGLGTWQFGGEWGKDFSQDDVNGIFDAARQTGINLIDTAECYGDHTSEAFIGEAIRRDRANWIVATKFGHKFHGYLNRTDERTAADALVQVEASLKALKTDYIDLLQYHSIRFEEFNNDELSAILEKMLQSGKVRHLGNSISGQTRKNVDQVEASTRRHVEAIQVIYNRLDRAPEEQVFALCQAQDLGVLARVPLASGYLSGKYKPGDSFPANDIRAGHDPSATAEKLREVARISREEVPPGAEMAQWALAWCLMHPAVTAVIPGSKTSAQVRSNARAADLDLVSGDHPQAWR